MTYLSLNAIGLALFYIASGIGLLAIFVALYVWWTPLNEFQLMRERKTAPAIALAGAMIGFVMPVLAMMQHSANWLDFIAWSLVAMVIQLALEWVLRRRFPNQIGSDNCAVAVFFFATSVCVGAINAYSFIPR